MNLLVATIETKCPRALLAAYVDGELSPAEELELELHLAVCKNCAAELNEQKKLLFALDFALEDESEFELPENFTEVVVANAESSVSGLRCSNERYKALFVCGGLFLTVISVLSTESEAILNTFVKFTEQFFAVCGFAVHLVYDISIGAAVILRSIGSQFANDSAIAFVLLMGFLLIFLFAASRLFNRFNRA